MDQVAWTRGQGCAEIADALSGGTATRIEGDLTEGCIRDRVDTLVTRKLTSFDLVPVVVPNDVDLSAVGGITVAVGEGPHSPLAVAVAARLAVTMEVPARAVSVQAPDTDVGDALDRIHGLIGHLDGVEAAVVEGSSVTALIEDSTMTRCWWWALRVVRGSSARSTDRDAACVWPLRPAY